jgi:phage antirepressor YoqD-like protein
MTHQAMSSREIAELTGSTHDNVLKTVRALLKKGVVSSNETPYKHPQNGQTYAEFLLGYRDTMVVVSGYSVELRAKIIDRWQELEEQETARYRIPTTFAEALQVAADQAKENQHLQLVIQQQAPKVEALQRLANTSGSICITEAAKHLGIVPLKLFGWMASNRWIYRRSAFANWSAFQPRLSSGLLEHKLVKIKNNESEELKVVEQVMVTRRGLVVLAEKIGASQ